MIIPGFPNYDISEEGVITNIITNKLLKYRTMTSGYYYISLYKEGKGYNRSIHRLLAQIFIPNPENLPCVNHKDGNRLQHKGWRIEVYD